MIETQRFDQFSFLIEEITEEEFDALEEAFEAAESDEEEGAPALLIEIVDTGDAQVTGTAEHDLEATCNAISSWLSEIGAEEDRFVTFEYANVSEPPEPGAFGGGVVAICAGGWAKISAAQSRETAREAALSEGGYEPDYQQ